MPNFFVILTAYSTILPSCLDIFLIIESDKVTKQSALNHISLFIYSCISLMHGAFVPDPLVFYYRNIFALVVSVTNCFSRALYCNKFELKREMYLGAFAMWLMGGVFIYAFSGINSEDEMIAKLSILVGASNNFNIYSSILPLIVHNEVNTAENTNQITSEDLFPLIVNSANTISSVLYSISDEGGINFYSNIIASFICMMTYILFFNDKRIYISSICPNMFNFNRV